MIAAMSAQRFGANAVGVCGNTNHIVGARSGHKLGANAAHIFGTNAGHIFGTNADRLFGANGAEKPAPIFGANAGHRFFGAKEAAQLFFGANDAADPFFGVNGAAKLLYTHLPGANDARVFGANAVQKFTYCLPSAIEGDSNVKQGKSA